ncbi:RES family NAD+ phosphorylase [Pseudoalteromonas sp. OF7H-1]|uniref:RES family NAD+ phosphorylase n=1 Tax=Pseudoalteromonas sp. OF7H-1 TaxID=2917755 RepID=UPI001EF550AC|nr:RES family NAD+ phosphorylase [Pseudoalteromonas sp. OF7H-1]MCG7541860.1 RES family NAD+ phosphorylase [Pseudoalteromonas sp. OF7H-1]
MNSNFENFFEEFRKEKIKKSIGFICKKCNSTALYFKTNNKDYNNLEQNCVICSKKSTKGLILEDFIFTLDRNIPNHYELVEKNTSDSIPLEDVVSRFTYNNKEFTTKISNLLCDKTPEFFKAEGRYKETVDDETIEKYKEESKTEWHEISNDVKHNRRFTNKKAIQFYEGLINNCFLSIDENDENFNSALTKIDKGVSFFRGRIVKDDSQKDTFRKNPKKELGAPPENLSASNRMSPSGISFLYTAGDYETAIAELRPYVGDTIAIGEFVSTKKLNFFDFTLLETIKIKKFNILEDPKNEKNIRNRYLLNELHKFVSKPVRPTDVTYIDLQILSETIRNYQEGMFDGIIFESSQRAGGLNYVIFGDYDEKENAKDYYVSLDSDSNVNFYKVREILTKTEKINN